MSVCLTLAAEKAPPTAFSSITTSGATANLDLWDDYVKLAFHLISVLLLPAAMVEFAIILKALRTTFVFALLVSQENTASVLWMAAVTTPANHTRFAVLTKEVTNAPASNLLLTSAPIVLVATVVPAKNTGKVTNASVVKDIRVEIVKKATDRHLRLAVTSTTALLRRVTKFVIQNAIIKSVILMALNVH